MFYSFYLAVFLVCSVVTDGERWSSESDLQRELTASVQEVAMGIYGNGTWKMPYKCCMCKESVRLARFLVMNELQEKSESICSIVKSVRDHCLSKAKVYQDKIVRVLFPGSPCAICKILKICKKLC